MKVSIYIIILFIIVFLSVNVNAGWVCVYTDKDSIFLPSSSEESQCQSNSIGFYSIADDIYHIHTGFFGFIRNLTPGMYIAIVTVMIGTIILLIFLSIVMTIRKLGGGY